ncbi:hypothetical protein HK102_012784 [Quaeritorhiza haematococci]|nr:hypothetical protein HK102_012784 [Quaeritorhiza haematococci]
MRGATVHILVLALSALTIQRSNAQQCTVGSSQYAIVTGRNVFHHSRRDDWEDRPVDAADACACAKICDEHRRIAASSGTRGTDCHFATFTADGKCTIKRTQERDGNYRTIFRAAPTIVFNGDIPDFNNMQYNRIPASLENCFNICQSLPEDQCHFINFVDRTNTCYVKIAAVDTTATFLYPIGSPSSNTTQSNSLVAGTGSSSPSTTPATPLEVSAGAITQSANANALDSSTVGQTSAVPATGPVSNQRNIVNSNNDPAPALDTSSRTSESTEGQLESSTQSNNSNSATIAVVAGVGGACLVVGSVYGFQYAHRYLKRRKETSPASGIPSKLILPANSVKVGRPHSTSSVSILIPPPAAGSLLPPFPSSASVLSRIVPDFNKMVGKFGFEAVFTSFEAARGRMQLRSSQEFAMLPLMGTMGALGSCLAQCTAGSSQYAVVTGRNIPYSSADAQYEDTPVPAADACACASICEGRGSNCHFATFESGQCTTKRTKPRDGQWIHVFRGAGSALQIVGDIPGFDNRDYFKVEGRSVEGCHDLCMSIPDDQCTWFNYLQGIAFKCTCSTGIRITSGTFQPLSLQRSSSGQSGNADIIAVFRPFHLNIIWVFGTIKRRGE